MKLQRTLARISAATLVAGCVVAAHAAERVYLRTGSSLVCDHQKYLNGQVRLYLTPSNENYLDVAVGEVVRTESVPDDAISALQSPVRPADRQAPAVSQTDLPELLDQAGARHHLDPDLLASIVHAESGGHPHAVSRAGAQGLMQLMPATAADLGVRNSFVAEQNIAGGTTYLDALLMYYHENVALALAAYNAGPAAVDRYHGVPPYAETRRYVERVIHDFNRRKLREERQRAAPRSTMVAIGTESR